MNNTPQLIDAQIQRIETLAPSILRVFLQPKEYIPYEAGQYLEILHSPTEPLFYSIANAPITDTPYELHIYTHSTMPLLRILHLNEILHLRLPFGQCTVNALRQDRPLILIAGGTGFAPMKAIIEDIYKTNRTRSITLLWSCKTAQRLYLHTEMQQLAHICPSFQYIPCITSHFSLEAMLKQHVKSLQLQKAEIILAGPFEMVYAVRDELLQHGVQQEQLHADAFTLT